jgi:hypothetical protein
MSKNNTFNIGPYIETTLSLPPDIEGYYSMSCTIPKKISAYTDIASIFYRYLQKFIGY